MVADADVDDGAVMGTASGISDEALSSADKVTAVTTTTGDTISGSLRAEELPEGVAIGGKGEEVQELELENFDGKGELRKKDARALEKET